MSRYLFGVTFFAGEHNPACLEFRYGTTTTKAKRQGHFVAYEGVRLYGLTAFGRFIGLVRFPNERVDLTRLDPPSTVKGESDS